MTATETCQLWHDAMGKASGDCLILKTRYGMVRIERTFDHNGALFMTYGSTEGLHTKLETAIDAAVKELAVRAQEQGAS